MHFAPLLSIILAAGLTAGCLSADDVNGGELEEGAGETDDGRVESSIWEGTVRCGISFVMQSVSPCNFLEVPGEDSRLEIELEPGIDRLEVEMEWQTLVPDPVFGEGMMLLIRDESGSNLRSVDGLSPLETGVPFNATTSANGGLVEIAVFSQSSLVNADVEQSFTVSYELAYAPAD